jgi:hypothetical protein
MLYLHIAYTRIVVVFMTCFYIVSVLNKPHIHHRQLKAQNPQPYDFTIHNNDLPSESRRADETPSGVATTAMTTNDGNARYPNSHTDTKGERTQVADYPYKL